MPLPAPPADSGRSWLPLRAMLAFALHKLLRRDWSGTLLARTMLEAMCDEPASTQPLMQHVRLAFRCVRWVGLAAPLSCCNR